MHLPARHTPNSNEAVNSWISFITGHCSEWAPHWISVSCSCPPHLPLPSLPCTAAAGSFKRKMLFLSGFFSCLATSTYFRGQMCHLTVVETTWFPKVGTWHRKGEEQMFIDFIAKCNYPWFWTLHTTHSSKCKATGSALCVLVSILGAPPDLTCAVHTATPQHSKQQPSEMWGARRITPHTAK